MPRKKKSQDQIKVDQGSSSASPAQVQSEEKPAEVKEAPEEELDQDKIAEEAKKKKFSAAKLEELKKRIAEKAKELASKVEVKREKVEINEAEVERPKGDLLVSLEEYVRSGIHLGTKVITAHMRPYVFKRRADGLAIFNTNIIDKKLRLAAEIISKYSPEQIVVAGKREASWKALKAFNRATGIKVFTKKYPAGIITNSDLEDFFEPKLMFVVDPWLDKNPISDALLINVPLLALCDTNNLLSNADLIIPCNNKSNKSIGLVFWMLAKEYNKARKIETEIPDLREFTGEL